jgi:hypothetical protein
MNLQLLSRLILFFVVASCAADKSRYGRVELYNGSGDRSSFVFTVSDDFISANKNSLQDKENPKLTEAESDLLASLLKERNFCLNKDGIVAFKITSRQEKIFDATFAHLIEENYRARPLTPRTYSGKCLISESKKR